MPFWGWILLFFGAVILIGAISDLRTKRRRRLTSTRSEIEHSE